MVRSARVSNHSLCGIVIRPRLAAGCRSAELGSLVLPARTPNSCREQESPKMKIKVVVHEAEEGSFWAEVPAIPGCATQGETMDELLRNVQEAIEACLSVDIAEPMADPRGRVLEIAI